MSEDQPVLLLDDVHKLYNPGPLEVHVLKGISLAVEEGDFVAITGSSGGGKSTMLNILGCLDTPTTGRYLISGTDVSRLSGNELARVRNRYLGFVFQGFNLIKRTTALANVELPLIYAGLGRRARRTRARAALSAVGLLERSSHLPTELSGGQQQRVAVARALVTTPALLLADEPTGNLDSASSADVLELIDRLHRAGRTIVLITHDADVARRAERVIVVDDGRLAEETATPAIDRTRSR
jgi:putative ABC transport system ATP-binding protein